MSIVHEDMFSPVLMEHEDDVIFHSRSREDVEGSNPHLGWKRSFVEKETWDSKKNLSFRDLLKS